jgi:hypothetical protein
VIPLIFAFISYKRAAAIYELEKPVVVKKYSIKLEKTLVRIINKITPSKYQILVITQFKEFIRKRENVNKTIYILVLNIMFGIFISISLDKPLTSITIFTPTFTSLLIEVLQFNYTIMLLLAWMGGFTFGLFMGIYVFINTKEITLLYKKSIRSVKVLVFSNLYNMFIICLIIGVILTIIFSIMFFLDFLSAVFFYLFFIMISMITLIQALGIQCIRPLYEERGKFIYFNMYFMALVQVISFILSLLLFIYPTSFVNYTLGLNLIIYIYIGISSIFATLLLLIGIIKLNRIE